MKSVGVPADEAIEPFEERLSEALRSDDKRKSRYYKS